MINLQVMNKCHNHISAFALANIAIQYTDKWSTKYKKIEFCQVVCSEFFNRTTELSTIIGQG